MEFIEGGTLHDYIQTSVRISEQTAQHIIRQVLEALQYMLEYHQISHRDLKPQVNLSLQIDTHCRTFFFVIGECIQLSRLPIWDSPKWKHYHGITHFADRWDIFLPNVLKVHKRPDLTGPWISTQLV